MLIEKIYTDMNAARKSTDTVAKNLLVTLYSEAMMVGKNKRNGVTTDEETVAVVKKFIGNTQEVIAILETRGLSAEQQVHEKTILEGYVPTQMTPDNIKSAVMTIMTELGVISPNQKMVGQVMAQLKSRYNGQYDGKAASEIVKSLLS
jgi:uncharacterized protein YqeY